MNTNGDITVGSALDVIHAIFEYSMKYNGLEFSVNNRDIVGEKYSDCGGLSDINSNAIREIINNVNVIAIDDPKLHSMENKVVCVNMCVDGHTLRFGNGRWADDSEEIREEKEKVILSWVGFRFDLVRKAPQFIEIDEIDYSKTYRKGSVEFDTFINYLSVFAI